MTKGNRKKHQPPTTPSNLEIQRMSTNGYLQWLKKYLAKLEAHKDFVQKELEKMEYTRD
jgi:hypothetical protein